MAHLEAVPAQPENRTDDPPGLNKRKLLLSGVLSTSAALILGLSYYWYSYEVTHVTTENAYVDTEIFPVNSRMMGFVKEVLAHENTRVKAGALLMRFDDTDINVEYTFKKAKFEKSVADLNRAVRLLNASAISRADFELARTNMVAQKADLDGTLLKLKYTAILAPTNGIVAKRGIQPGQFVQPGQSLFVIVPEQPTGIRANLKETQLEFIEIGMPVEIRVDAYPGMRLQGHVESIAPTSGSKMSLIPPDNSTGNFTKVVQKIPVIVRLDTKPRKPLRAGMSVVATILTSGRNK
jgi:membrane fusion protein (multidrug efflux system)